MTEWSGNGNISTEVNAKSLILVLFGVLMVVSVEAGPEMRDFSRYQVIITRRPFGAPPVRAGTRVRPPPAVADPFKNYRLVGITRGDADDVSVGIVDIGSNPAKSIFLNLGSSDQDLMLVDADFELEGALIRKGRDEKWLYLGGSMPGGSSMTTARTSASGATKATSKGVSSYIERMRARRARGRTVTTVIQPSKLKGEELKKHLQEYNMELIRKAAKGDGGAPPLPIPLTPEQDKQLVEEGVLPAQE